MDKKEKLDNKKPDGSIIVAEESGKVIGIVFYTWDNWDSSIYRLAVDPDYWGKTIGTQLLCEAEKRLKASGADIASLRTHANNSKAQEFFKNSGYEVVGGPYIDMEKKL